MSSSPPARIESIDTLRGFALLGILLVNCAYFALPQSVAGQLSAARASGPVDLAAWALVRAFFELKFVALFSFLFGIGFALQSEGKSNDRGFTWRYLRRLLLLALFGALHGVFLFMGDILLCYAFCGAVLLLTGKLSPGARLIGGAVLVLGMIPWIAALMGLEALGGPVPATGTIDLSLRTDPRAVLEAYVSHGPADFALLEQAVFAEGPAASSITLRAFEFGIFLLFCLLYFGWRVLGFFFLGAAAFQLGLLGARGEPWLRRMRLLGLGLGVPLALGATGLAIWSGDAPSPPLAAANGALAELAGLLVPMGYAGAVLLWAAGADSPLRRALGAVGRMALTNYIAQSVVMSFLFCHWGLGLYGQFGLAELLGISALVLLAQLVLSPLWLSRFRMGPLEWIWRWATYGRRPAFRKQPAN